MTIPSHISPHLFLNEALTETGLVGSRLCFAAMTTLRHMGEQGGIGLTQSGAVNCKFVTWTVDQFNWPGYTTEELYTVLNEDDVPPLCYLHEPFALCKADPPHQGYGSADQSRQSFPR